MAEGGGIQSASKSRYITTPNLLVQEAGNSGMMGGLRFYLRCMHDGYRIQRRVEALVVMVNTVPII